MIDWTKLIETTDGRKVTVLMLNAVHVGMETAKPVAIVKIEGEQEDGRGWFAAYSMDGVVPLNHSVPHLRNALVKREGWVNIYKVHETEAEARASAVDNGVVMTRFVRWEE